jgi:hypothetical protein
LDFTNSNIDFTNSDIYNVSKCHNQVLQKEVKGKKMLTLFIGAPYWKAPPGQRYSFEYIYQTGTGEEYAIWQKWALIIKPGMPVVLLRNDKSTKRAEGILAAPLKPTGKYIKGVQRYDVHIGGLTHVAYKKPPQKLNPFGVLVI